MIDLTLWLVFILVLIRVASFLVASPVFSLRNIPNNVKIGAALILALVLLPQIQTGNVLVPDNAVQFAGYVVSETLTGLVLGMAASSIFAAVRMAGQLMDIQIGFAMAMIVDPANGTQNTLVGQFLYLIGVLLFFSLDIHHLLISALAKSFDLLAPGGLLITGQVILNLMKTYFLMFTYAVRMALPVVVVLIISDISLGLISKTVPQFNVLMIGFPLKIGVGILTLVLLLPVLATIIGNLFQTMDNQILLLLGGG
ncbi:flagellar biosynthetic protein FliR [Candidatus Formimonas warabiya]|uniref:Flagellar biosynthetic protein FliR n=1 Tax=Formimonas warabiya TaxID=1761012 RepID=A0A3G1KT03_FORW1|nr:flagellar biosynthetic protein FliR [Candidatus Formimonas warabiya]ATW25653.1 flagellar biosynthetic protein FliR [Candidatus Formimonas warabiya]